MTTGKLSSRPALTTLSLSLSTRSVLTAALPPNRMYSLSIAQDTVWAIHVYGRDQSSQFMARPFDAVAHDNSSLSGGSLPANMRFARLSYDKETVLATRLWIWKAPVVVITDPALSTVRFFKVGQIVPRQDAMAALLAQPEVWTTMPPWSGRLAPGGAWEPALVKAAGLFEWWHRHMSRIPSLV